MKTRINQTRQHLSKLHIDALFITNQLNVTYLTEFSGLSPHERESFLLITLQDATLLTYPTYFDLYKRGGEEFTVKNISYDKPLYSHINDIITNNHLQVIGIERDNLTVSEFASLKKKCRVRFIPTSDIVENLRQIKSVAEITSIRKAAALTDKTFEYIKSKIKKGVSELDICIEIECFIKKQYADCAFSPIVAFGKNAAIPHYLPPENVKLKDKTSILIDFGTKVRNYCSDMTRVLFYGTPSSQMQTMYKTVLQAQQLALEKLQPGVSAKSVDLAARDYIISSGFPQYPHSTGHGVGLAIHEAPKLKKDSKDTLKEHMVVTVEPGIYLQGEGGVRIEDLVVLKKNGYEILSTTPKEVTII